MTLADRLIVMNAGVAEQFDSPLEVYQRPATTFVAGFIGSPSINFFDGKITVGSSHEFSADGISIPLDRYEFANAPVNADVSFGIRPEHVQVGETASTQPISTTINIDVVEPMGSDTLVWSKIGDRDSRFRVDGQTTLKPGDDVLVGFDPARASIFNKKTELRV